MDSALQPGLVRSILISGLTDVATARVLDWMSSLGDLTRVRVLHACDKQELSVAELCAVLQIPQSTASRHLKVLSEDGWLAARREGTSRLYRVDKEQLPVSARKLWKLIEQQCHEDAALRDDDQRLEQVVLARQNRSQAFFASSAGQWDRLRGELFGSQLDVLALAALLEADSVVGDLGCGTGRLSELAAGFATRVHAIDASGEMIKAARQRLRGRDNVELHRAQLEDLPLDDGTLDVAFLSLVLHHVGDPGRVFEELGRVLRPGGKAVVVDMQQHDREEYRQQMGHSWLGFSPGQIREWASRGGVPVVRFLALPPDPAAKGPPLFVATARAPSRKNGFSARGPNRAGAG